VAGIRSSNMIVFYQRGVTGVLFLTGRGYTFNPQIPSVIVPITAGNISFIQAPNTTPTTPSPASEREVLKHVNTVEPTPKRGPEEAKKAAGQIAKDYKTESGYKPTLDVTQSVSPGQQKGPDTDLKTSPGQQKSSGVGGGVSSSKSTSVSTPGTEIMKGHSEQLKHEAAKRKK